MLKAEMDQYGKPFFPWNSTADTALSKEPKLLSMKQQINPFCLRSVPAGTGSRKMFVAYT